MNKIVAGSIVAAAALLAVTFAGCVATGQNEVAVPLAVAGSEVPAALLGRDGALIELHGAELAFGPLYLCAGDQAGELCETARLEWLGSAVVDALDPQSRTVGELAGVTGEVRSWMFDLGITSLLTEPRPVVLDAARALGGNSVRLLGSVEVAGRVLPFAAELPLSQQEATEIGVPLVRKSSSDAFEHDVTGEEPRLSVRFDPRPWVAQVDFSAWFVEDVCAADGPAVACVGTVEQTCAADGTVASQRDCAAENTLCLRGRGCQGEIVFEEGDQGALAIRNQIVSGPRPQFEWETRP